MSLVQLVGHCITLLIHSPLKDKFLITRLLDKTIVEILHWKNNF